MTEQEYRDIDALSASGMNALSRSPSHYKAWKESSPESTPSMELGIATHMAILEPDRFYDTYIPNECPQDASPAVKAAETKRLKKSYPNHIILPSASYIAITGMQTRVLEHPFAASLLEGSVKEKVITWDYFHMTPCKGRLDILKNGIIADIKTTYDARLFQHTIVKYNLHRQAAFYFDGVGASEFYWIVVEKQPPYGMIVYKASNNILQLGRSAYEPLVLLYQACLDSGQFHCYGDEIIEIMGDENDTNPLDDVDCPF